jgi:hypothetical protein
MGSEAGREDGSEACRGDKARPPLVGGSKGEGARLEGGIACVLTEGTRNHYVGLTRPPNPGDTTNHDGWAAWEARHDALTLWLTIHLSDICC